MAHKPVGLPPKSPGAPLIQPAAEALPTASTQAVTKPAPIFGTDAIADTPSPASQGPTPTAKISGPEVIGDRVRSEFPLDDLGKLVTRGRAAQGFRLDGGSLRRMWMAAKRTVDKEGTPGFELYFQAQGAAIETYRRRLEQAGAAAGSLKFAACELDQSVADKHALKHTDQEWGPSTQKALHLETAGKWSVDMVTGDPEALRGAFRIVVKGDDPSATAGLGEIIKRLGLQSLFAPPAPTGLERYKLLQFMWQVAPEALDPLRARPVDELVKKLPETLAVAEPDAAKLSEIQSAKLDTPAMKRRGQLLRLLYEKSPKRFFEWVKGGAILVLKPGQAEPNGSLDAQLKAAGLTPSSPEVLAALKKAPDPEVTRALLQLGLLWRTDADSATSLAARDLESVKLPELEAALAAAGIDPAGERVKGLEFKEVYPGYFTVLDPALAKEAQAAGARYLYSTLDDVDRVLSTLRSGQKSSLTRFQEGQLILGKSSGADFDSGGAGSVFTRLVTDSIIKEAAKREPSYLANFNDWGGSRPFKLILNRRVLARSDWYGYAGDNFGRTTTVGPSNHGATIIKAINGKYSSSNELMFPVGSDASYIDYVVAPSEEQKKKLVDHLVANGITELGGLPIADRILVRTRFFEHPDDETLATLVRDTVFGLDFGAALEKAKPTAAAPMQAAVEAGLPSLVTAALAKDAQGILLEGFKSSADSRLTERGQKHLLANAELLAPLAIEQHLEAATVAAVHTAAESAVDTLKTSYSYDEHAEKSAVQTAVAKSVKSMAGKLLDAKLHQEVEAVVLGSGGKGSVWDIKQSLKNSIKEALLPKVRAEVERLGLKVAQAKLAEADNPSARSAAADRGVEAARQVAAEVVLGELNPAAIEALLAALKGAVESDALASLHGLLTAEAKHRLESDLSASLREAAAELAAKAAGKAMSPAVLEELSAALTEAGTKAAAEFVTRHPGQLSDADQASLGPLSRAAAEDLVLDSARALANSKVQEPLKAAVQAGVQALLEAPETVAQASAAIFEARAEEALRRAISDAVKSTVGTALETELKKAIGARLESEAPALRETQISQVLDRVAADLIDSATYEHEKRIDKAAQAILKRRAGDAGSFWSHLVGGF